VIALVLLVACAAADDAAPVAPLDAGPVAPVAPVAPPDAVAPAPTRDKLLVLDVAGEPESLADRRGLADELASLFLARSALDVAPASSVRDRLALAADRTESGCDASSCATEAADAIGARFVLFSRLTMLADTRTLRLEIFDGRDARAVSVVVVRGDSIVALAKELPRAVDELIDRSDGALPKRDEPAPVIEAPGFFDRPGATNMVTGGVALGVGVLAAAGWGYPAYVGAERQAFLRGRASAYEEEPSVDNARDVIDAKVRVDEMHSVQVLASPLFLVAAAGLLGGTVLLVQGATQGAP
jgi:hypothetical protein